MNVWQLHRNAEALLEAVETFLGLFNNGEFRQLTEQQQRAFIEMAEVVGRIRGDR